MRILGCVSPKPFLALICLAYSHNLATLWPQEPQATSFVADNLPTVNLADDYWLADAIQANSEGPYVGPVAGTALETTLGTVEKNNTRLANSELGALDEAPASSLLASAPDYLSTNANSPVHVGYDGGFVISSRHDQKLGSSNDDYRMVINGWGQLRDTVFDARGGGSDLNQLQLKRARLVFSGHAFNPDFRYFVQIDGRSSSGDSIRILDYYLTYDIGHHRWDMDRDTFGFKTGLYKMPFNLARQLSGQELQFSDRSMSSMYFDVNRSLAGGLYGKFNALSRPIHWEVALFNGLVTGGAETGSSGNLDNNNAFSARMYCFPSGQWQEGQLADLTFHDTLATRLGAGFAATKNDRIGSTEFNGILTVDTGTPLSTALPAIVDEYRVALYSVDGSMKFAGVSATCEYYFRNLSGFRGASIPDLFDHGFWLETGVFIVPRKFQWLSRWSRVQGSSGSLGGPDTSSEEIASGLVCYFKDQQAKLTVDATYLNGASINSSTLDINAGDRGWLYRTQVQFSF